MKKTPALSSSLLATAILVASAAHGGVWTSGGSELIKDSANPWFVQNTPAIRVCIVADPATFHVTGALAPRLKDATLGAFSYWRAEFAKSWSVANIVKVATQSVEIDDIIVAGAGGDLPRRCPDTTSLTMQFGWLTSDQEAYLKAHHRPGDLVAITVRTDYDTRALAAKGFVFVAGDEGAWAVRGPQIVQHPWRLGKGHLLTEVLKHELGHVFGLPHLGIEGPMAVDYAERSLQRGVAESLAESGSTAAFFKIDGDAELRRICYPADKGMRAGWRAFLGAPRDHLCMGMDLHDGRVSFATGPSLEKLAPRGTLVFEGDERFTWQDAVRIYLPPEQTAVPCPDAGVGAGACPWLVGPMIKITDRSGLFTSADGKLKRRTALTLSPLGLGFAQAKLSAEIDGAWHWNLDWEY